MSKDKKTALVPKLRFPEFRDCGEWERGKLGNVTYPISRKNTLGEEYPIYSINNKNGFLPQIDQFEGMDSKARGYDISLYKIVDKNTFAYNPARINVGSIGYSGELHNIIISSLYVCFKTNIQIDDGFFQHFLSISIFNKQVKNNAEGGIRSYLFYENFAKIKLAFPDIIEQQKIADCLSSLDELISAEDQKLAALKAHKKGLMQKLFPAEGETVPERRFPEFRDSGEWERKTISSLCDMQAGKFVQASDIHDRGESNMFPCYGGNGLRGYTFSFTHSGDYPLIGRQGALCGNITYASGKFHATEHAIVATNRTHINTKWLYYLLIILNLNQYATGQAQPGLSVQVLEKVMTYVPKSENEQQKIAYCLSSVDDLITAQVKKIEALKLHKKGLMQGLFPSMEDITA